MAIVNMNSWDSAMNAAFTLADFATVHNSAEQAIQPSNNTLEYIFFSSYFVQVFRSFGIFSLMTLLHLPAAGIFGNTFFRRSKI